MWKIYFKNKQDEKINKKKLLNGEKNVDKKNKNK